MHRRRPVVKKIDMTGELRSVTFTLPILTPGVNEIRRMHFGAYKKMREMFAWSIRGALNSAGYWQQAPMARAVVTIERYSANKPIDQDGASGGVKPLVDCLVLPSARHPNGLGVITDDKPSSCLLTVRCYRADTFADQRTVVTIQEQEPEKALFRKHPRQGERVKARKAREAKASAIHTKYLPGM